MYKYKKSTFIDSDEELKDVVELDCSNCRITSFEGLNASNLTTLYCSNNQISTFEHLNTPNLTLIKCSNNQISTFEHLNAPKLTELHCSSNQISSFKGLNAPKIIEFYCFNNKISSFEYLNAPKLIELYCSNNQISSFEHLNVLHLIELFCSSNQISSFEYLNAPKLTKLYCSNNQISSFEHLNAPNLTLIKCSNNLFEFIPLHINRILNRTRQNIYNDSQNVHDHNIQETVRKSITNILCHKPTIDDIYDTILSDDILTQQTKEILIDYCNDTNIHSTLNISFKDLLIHTFSRININSNKDEIKRILSLEMTDSLCKCFTGRISRLINCLNGFDDLVNINISDTEQIGQIISLIEEQLDNDYNVDKHKEIVQQELLTRGYSQHVIDKWIYFIE